MDKFEKSGKTIAHGLNYLVEKNCGCSLVT